MTICKLCVLSGPRGGCRVGGAPDRDIGEAAENASQVVPRNSVTRLLLSTAEAMAATLAPVLRAADVLSAQINWPHRVFREVVTQL